MPLWKDIREVLLRAHDNGREWLTAREIAREVLAVKPEANPGTLSTIVRYYAINDPSKKHGASPIYLRNPLFVTDSPTTRGKQYRLLSDVERQTFLASPREDLEQISYQELLDWLQEASSTPGVARLISSVEELFQAMESWAEVTTQDDSDLGASLVWRAQVTAKDWIHDTVRGGFGPASFLAYANLNPSAYLSKHSSQVDRDRARAAIEQILGARFRPDQNLQSAFLNWSYGATGFDPNESSEPDLRFLSLNPMPTRTPSGTEVPHDSSSWSDAAFSSQFVVVRYPAPIALPYQRYCGSPAGFSRLVALVSATEHLLRYLVAIAAADLFRCLGKTGASRLQHHPELEPLFSGMDLQLGHWVGLLKGLMRALQQQSQPALPQFVEACQPEGRVLTLLGRIVTKRNKWIHPKGGINVSDERAVRECRQVRPWLEEAIQRLGFLCDYPLGYATRSRAKADRYRLFSCMGTKRAEGYAFQTKAPIEEGVPFLTISPSRVLYLWPLLAQRLVAASQQRSLYCFERIERRARCLTRVRLTALDQRDEIWERVLDTTDAASHAWLIERVRDLDARAELSVDFDLAAQLQNNTRQRQLVGRRLGPYLLEALVGRGGFGAIYQGVDTSTHMHVAVKVLDPNLKGREAYRRFQREFEKLEEVGGHPGIVRCFQSDSALIDGAEYDWYSMEFATGGDLAGRLGSRPHTDGTEVAAADLPWNDEHRRREIVVAFEAIATALAHLHASNVVHRDIKPSNVLVMDDGSLRLADFGLVKSRAPSESLLTSVGAVLGTRVYMAPEQERGEDVDERADVYSLGVVLAEMATGFRPERPGTPKRGSSLRSWRPLRRLPETLQEFVRRATDLDPSERFPDAQQALAAFRRIQTAPASSPPGRQWVLYWLPKTVDEHPTGQIDYAASGQFARRRVFPGDVIWIVTARDGYLTLVGRLEVGLVTDRQGAEEALGRSDLWEAEHYAIARTGTVAPIVEIDLTSSLGALEFASSSNPSVHSGEDGRVNPQQLQAVRELTAAGARSLQDLLGRHEPS